MIKSYIERFEKVVEMTAKVRSDDKARDNGIWRENKKQRLELIVATEQLSYHCARDKFGVSSQGLSLPFIFFSNLMVLTHLSRTLFL